MSQKMFAGVPGCGMKLVAAITLLTGILGGSAWAQDDAASPQEPQYNDQFFAFSAGGALTPLEQQKMVHQMKSQNRFISVKVTGEEVVPGSASPVRLGPGAKFIVRTGALPDGVDPNTLISLRPFAIEKNQRAILKNSAGGFIFSSAKGQTAQDNSLAVTFKKYGSNSLQVVPSKPLAPGEYVLMTHSGVRGVSCFGVDSGIASPPDNTSASGVSGDAAAGRGALVWRIHPSAKPDPLLETFEATLPGTAETNGRRGSALLDVKCNIHHYTDTSKTDATIDTELRVRRNMVQFATDPLTCMGDTDGDYNDFAHIRLGSGQETAAQFCYDGDLPTDQNAIVGFGLGIDALQLDDSSAAGSLSIRLRIGEAKADNLNANFAAAQNASALRTMLSPCLQMIDAAARAEETRIVVSCPVVPDKSLTAVDVLAGTAMRKLPPDPDNDVGVAWYLPKASKTHVRPKLTLACNYKSSAQLQDAKAKPERKLLPIPVDASSCEFRSGGSKKMHGSCSREESKQ